MGHRCSSAWVISCRASVGDRLLRFTVGFEMADLNEAKTRLEDLS
jgi:hypothetical protein